jgi:sigma-B regulation protein RsbU (phosphoserine phosphatase)
MALRALFESKPDHLRRDPVHAEVPKLRDAAMAATYYDPRIGGDLYDVIRVHPDGVLFALLDVAGCVRENHHIVTAAQATFRKVGAALFAKDDINEPQAMIDLCVELNRTILQSAHGVRECPAFAGCYREGLGTLCYFNAGHTPGLLLDQSGITELPATGLPLGLFSHAVCDASIVVLPPGAALLLVSRGVPEAERDRAEFGLDRVKEYFLQNGSQNASNLSHTLLTELQQFASARTTINDMTAVALVRPVPRTSKIATS